MNKTITRIVKPVGVIETVNVAALINKKFKIEIGNDNLPVKDESTGRFIKSPLDRSQDEKNSLANLIKAAAGGEIATVSLEEIEFDDVNEKIADIEIAALQNEENKLLSPKKKRLPRHKRGRNAANGMVQPTRKLTS